MLNQGRRQISKKIICVGETQANIFAVVSVNNHTQFSLLYYNKSLHLVLYSDYLDILNYKYR